MAAHQIQSQSQSPVPADASMPWRVHVALESWGARVDVKASILLAYQGGGFVLGVTSREFLMAGFGRWPGLLAVALGLLLLAMCAGAAAVLPMLGSARRLCREHATNVIYFGHLRTWSAPALAVKFSEITPDEEVAMLSRQLVAMSRFNWRKHRLLQVSVALTMLALLAGAAAVVTGYLSQGGVGDWAAFSTK